VRAVLVGNSPVLSAARLRLWAAESDFVVGVDGGAARLIACGLRPTHVMGDFDSLSPADLADAETAGASIVELADQDYTDIDKSIRYAIHDLGSTQIAIFGVSGGRLDHMLTALNALAKYGHLADVRIVDDDAETLSINGIRRFYGVNLRGRTLSLMPLGDVDGVTLTGVKWPLVDARLGPGGCDGTSNVITADVVTVQCARGSLLVSLHHAASSEAISLPKERS